MLERILAYFFITADDVRDRLRRDDGATAVEYGLLIALIGVVLIAALLIFGPSLAGLFEGVAERF
jgi:pilus assembly protein Flp/PilA